MKKTVEPTGWSEFFSENYRRSAHSMTRLGEIEEKSAE